MALFVTIMVAFSIILLAFALLSKLKVKIGTCGKKCGKSQCSLCEDEKKDDVQ